MDVFILGLDTGFANLGWAVTLLSKERLSLIELGHFSTSKDTKRIRKGLRSTDDDFERAVQIAARLEALVVKYPDLGLLCVEQMSWVRNASAMAKIGMTFGVTASIVKRRELPRMAFSPQEIKMATTGNKKAEKADVEAALNVRFPNAKVWADKLAKGVREHPYDALGAIVAGWDTDTMRLLRARVA